MPNESAKIILAVTNGKLSKVRDSLAVEGTINALNSKPTKDYTMQVLITEISSA